MPIYLVLFLLFSVPAFSEEQKPIVVNSTPELPEETLKLLNEHPMFQAVEDLNAKGGIPVNGTRYYYQLVPDSLFQSMESVTGVQDASPTKASDEMLIDHDCVSPLVPCSTGCCPPSVTSVGID